MSRQSTPFSYDVSLELLESISPENLMVLLSPYRQYFEAQGLSLEPEAVNEHWCQQLYELLGNPAHGAPDEVRQALVAIEPLATDASAEWLASLPVSAGMATENWNDPPSSADLATQLYLFAPDQFAKEATLVETRKSTCNRVFLASGDRELVVDDIRDAEQRVRDYVRDFFVSSNRGTYVDCRIGDTPDELHMLVIHGRTPRRQGVIRPDATRTVLKLMPDKHDTLVYDPAERMLHINAQYRNEVELYRQAFGELFFGDAEYFPNEALVDCSLLLSDPILALSSQGIVGLNHVEIRDVAVKSLDAKPAVRSWGVSGGNVTDLFLSDWQRIGWGEHEVTFLKLALHLRGVTRPTLVELRPSNSIKFRRGTGSHIVDQYLRESFVYPRHRLSSSLRRMSGD